MRFVHDLFPDPMELDIIPDYITDGWRLVGRYQDNSWVISRHLQRADAQDDHTDRVARILASGWRHAWDEPG